MSINLSIAANDHDDLHRQLKGILYGLAQTAVAGGYAATPTVIPVEGVITVEPVKAKVTRGKKADEPRQETVAETRTEAAKQELHPNQEQPDTQPPTLDDVRGALKTYATAVFKAGVAAGKEELEAKNDANGAGLAVLMEIAGTTPTSAVPEGKRAAVIAEANRLLAALNVPTREDVVAALNRLSSAEGHGTEAVFDLLASFSAKSSKDVREDQRALVIAAVKQKLESAA